MNPARPQTVNVTVAATVVPLHTRRNVYVPAGRGPSAAEMRNRLPPVRSPGAAPAVHVTVYAAPPRVVFIGAPLAPSGSAGLLADPVNPQDLAEKMRRLLGDPDLRREMGRRGREKVLAEFTIEKVTDAILRVYEGALRERRPTARP